MMYSALHRVSSAMGEPPGISDAYRRSAVDNSPSKMDLRDDDSKLSSPVASREVSSASPSPQHSRSRGGLGDSSPDVTGSSPLGGNGGSGGFSQGLFGIGKGGGGSGRSRRSKNRAKDVVPTEQTVCQWIPEEYEV